MTSLFRTLRTTLADYPPNSSAKPGSASPTVAGKAVLASSPSPRPISTASADQLLELDRTLDELAAQDEALEISLSTVKRDWQFSRAWLYTRLKGPAAMSSDLSIQELEAVFPAHSP